ncbi:MAG TPA: 4'-phosphopantetheinyl transferase superfamily protein [bacterium]|nr:4'-phosphopantetheinyl transferase superfamily protein [bacterium]
MNRDEIHLWRAGLDLDDFALQSLSGTLSAGEAERAARFLREIDRRRFTAARGILRRLVADYLDSTPSKIRLAYGEKGKPSLVDGGGLSFNLSHCQGRALYALAFNREIGVDLELPRADLDVEGLAGRYFSAAEAARIVALPKAERANEFYRLWTAKEAYAKARGLGLSLLGEEPDSVAGFHVEELKLKAGEFSALAYSGEKAELKFFEFGDR